MTTKEKIIHKTIKTIKNRISKIDHIVYANPASDIIKLRQEAIEQSKTMTPNDAVFYLNNKIKAEKALFALAAKQKNSSKLITEKVDLEYELQTLYNELYYLNQNK